MFKIKPTDSCKNFWKHYKLKRVFGRIFVANTPFKKYPFTYFLINKEQKDKQFLRVTDNFFIEI